jgi:phytoene dehydrogenase-like protein
MSPAEYERKKEEVADALVARVEAYLPGLAAATVFREVGSPRTHRRFLGRADGSYGPIPARRPAGMLGMPFNRTAIQARSCTWALGAASDPDLTVTCVPMVPRSAHKCLFERRSPCM